MKNLNKYLYESLFDEESKMDSLNCVADYEKLKKCFKGASYDIFINEMEEFEQKIQKYGEKISYTKANYDEKYISFEKGKNHRGQLFAIITVWVPVGNKYMIYSMTYIDHSRVGREIFKYFNEPKSSMKKLSIHNYKNIYKLPKEYEFIIELLEKDQRRIW